MRTIILAAMGLIIFSCNSLEQKPEYKSDSELHLPLFSNNLKVKPTWRGLFHEHSRDYEANLPGKLKAIGFEEIADKNFKYSGTGDKNVLTIPYERVLIQVAEEVLPKDDGNKDGMGLGTDLAGGMTEMKIKLIFIALKNENDEFKKEEAIEKVIGQNFVSFVCETAGTSDTIHANITKYGESIFLVISGKNPKVGSVNILPPNDYFWDKSLFKDQSLKRTHTLDIILPLFSYEHEKCKAKDI